MVILDEIHQSESQLPQEDRFEELVRKTIHAIEQDGHLNTMTARMYKLKKFFLIGQLTELFHLHKVLLADQHVGSSDSNPLQLVKFIPPQSPPKRDDSKVDSNHPSLLMSKVSDLEEEIVSLNEKLQSSDDVITELRRRVEQLTPKTDDSEVPFLMSKISDLEQEIVSLNQKLQSSGDEITKLRRCVVLLKSKWDDSEVGVILLPYLISDISDLEEEIVSLNEKLHSSEDVITKLTLKIEEKDSVMQSKQNYINSQKTRVEAEKATVKRLTKQIADLNAEITANNVRAEELKKEVEKIKAKNKEIDEHMSKVLLEKVCEKAAFDAEISELKRSNKAREDVSNNVIRKLNKEVAEKSEIFGALMTDKDEAEAKLKTLEAEHSSLQAERARAALSFENVEKITNELKLKLAELETEVEMQKNVNDPNLSNEEM